MITTINEFKQTLNEQQQRTLNPIEAQKQADQNKKIFPETKKKDDSKPYINVERSQEFIEEILKEEERNANRKSNLSQEMTGIPKLF